MENKPLRLGIVGCGAVTRAYHLPTLTQMPAVVVAVLCDKDRQSAEAARKLFGLRALITNDVNQLTGSVDAALVATPLRSHAQIAIELLRAGIDVLCEKPLAATSLDAAQYGRCRAAVRTNPGSRPDDPVPSL